MNKDDVRVLRERVEEYFKEINTKKIISGGITKEDYFALYELLNPIKKEGIKICEIGTWCGMSTSIIGAITQEYHGQLVCVDWFKGGETSNLQDSIYYYNIKNIFLENIKRLKMDYIINLYDKSSEEASKLFEDNYFDVVFIDGDHRYTQFKQDLDMWYPKVKSKGIICGHDCDIPIIDVPDMLNKYCELDYLSGLHFGVLKALYEKFPDTKKIENSVIWYKEKP